MGLWKSWFGRAFVVAGLAGVCLVQSSGCYSSPTVARNWARHAAVSQQETAGSNGMNEVESIEPLKVTLTPPGTWNALPLKKTSLYSHKQWRSPSRHTGVGVVYIRLPLPLPMSTLVWFAKQEYTKKENDGRLIGQWTDNLGRQWFEAENNKYHVKGYAVMNGLDAWIVYSGYRTNETLEPEQVELANRAMDNIRPLVGGKADARASAD
jgi:hypothetical protein